MLRIHPRSSFLQKQPFFHDSTPFNQFIMFNRHYPIIFCGFISKNPPADWFFKATGNIQQRWNLSASGELLLECRQQSPNNS